MVSLLQSPVLGTLRNTDQGQGCTVPAILPPQAGTFQSAPSSGAFSRHLVPEPILTGLRSIAPRQRESLLDKNLPEIPATDDDTERAAVAVLPMPLDRGGRSSRGGQPSLALRPITSSRSQRT